MRLKYLPLLLLWLATPAESITVSPISAELDLSSGRSHVIRVINTNEDRSSPIKVEAFAWALTPNGADQRGPTDALIVFPGQFILKPGETRSVRIASRVAKKPEIEQSYRILISELPVDLTNRNEINQQSGVRLLTAYATAFYVRPANPRSELHLDAVQRRPDGLLFKVSNHGNVHSHLMHLRLVFTQGDKTASITAPDDMPNFYNGNVLASSVREFFWKWPSQGMAGIDTSRPLAVRMALECESCGGTEAVFDVSVP